MSGRRYVRGHRLPGLEADVLEPLLGSERPMSVAEVQAALPGHGRTHVRYNGYVREENLVTTADIGLVPLGYGRFVRADEIVAVLPIEEGRGRGRRTYVHVRGLAAPIVASRSQQAILADMKAASRSGQMRSTHADRRLLPASQPDLADATRRRVRLGFGARRA